MKKFLPYILIFTIIVQLFAPFGLGLQKNKAEASLGFISTDLGITLNTTANVTSNSIKLESRVKWVTNTWLSSESIIMTIKGPDGISQFSDAITLTPKGELEQTGSATFTDLKPATEYTVYIKADQDSKSLLGMIVNLGTWIPRGIGRWIGADDWAVVGKLFQKNKSDGEITNIDEPYKITTLAAGDTSTQTTQLGILQNGAAFLPVCNIKNVGGCIGVILYRLFFQPSSYLLALTGTLLDFTFGYSIQDSSYRSEFVLKGWQLMRDICNMFFIFVLLYIAIGTILKLHGVKTQEMIINVVIIGLLMNFSLFATHVIIDTSNILARVFYNQINVGHQVDGVVVEDLGDWGEKRISEIVVSKINPQKILMSVSEGSQIKSKGVSLSGDENSDQIIDVRVFILLTILATAMNVIGIIVFLSVGMVLILRVVGLWVAMIFAPAAFFTYTIPAAKKVETIGWEHWWPDTLKMAFLAPVFIFFIYLITMFLETGLGMGNTADKHGLAFYISVLVPFAILMTLLTKAKSISVKMAGKMGETVSKAGAAIGGMALGAGLAAATGGASMLMRGTLGNLGNKMANSQGLKNIEAKGGIGGWGAKQLRNIGTASSKSSFDIRATKVGAQMQSGMSKGLGTNINMGKAKTGGFEKFKSDQIEAREKRAKELELGEDSKEVQDIRKAEVNLNAMKTDRARQDRLLNLNNGDADSTNDIDKKSLGALERDLAATEKSVADAERALKDAVNNLAAVNARPGTTDPERLQAEQAVENAKKDRDAEIRGGARANGTIVATGRDQAKQYLEDRKENIRKTEKPIHEAENALKRAENVRIEKNNQIRGTYAKSIQKADLSHTINVILSGGQSTLRGERKAANKILSGMEEMKKENPSH